MKIFKSKKIIAIAAILLFAATVFVTFLVLSNQTEPDDDGRDSREGSAGVSEEELDQKQERPVGYMDEDIEQDDPPVLGPVSSDPAGL